MIDLLIEAALATLPPRSRVIVGLRLGPGEPYTLAEVGDMVDPPIGGERVRQLEARAIRHIRHPQWGLAAEYDPSAYSGRWGRLLERCRLDLQVPAE